MFTFLPRGYREDTIREYRTRVLTVFVALCIVLVILSIALTMPTFVSLYYQKTVAASEKAQAEALQAQSADSSASAAVARVDARLAAIRQGTSERTVISLFERLLAPSRPGISITALSAARDEKNGTLRVEGVAATRESLVAFSRALQGEPSFASVDLPVSSLAKNRDIQFSISIGLKP